jgi:hypothetical protein
MVHMPLFNVEIPKEAMSLIKLITGVATFDIPYVNIPEINRIITGDT